MKKRKVRPSRRRIGAMLKPFRAQVFESRKQKAGRKTRLKAGEDGRSGW